MTNLLISMQSTTMILSDTNPMDYLHTCHFATAASNEYNMDNVIVVSANGGSLWTDLR